MRPDGYAKAHGTAQYTADALPRPYLLAAPLTTRLPHSRVGVDTESLRALPGVVAALGPDDDPGWLYSTNPHGGADDTIVFTNTGRFAGDTVGAVVATDRTSLELALSSGCVSEEPLPFVASLRAAQAGLAVANPAYPDNLIADVWRGQPAAEVEAELAASPLRHRTAVTIGPAAHGFMERVAAGAQFVGGVCRVWSPTQCPQLVQIKLAELLDCDVIMEPVYIGGGFGGKEEMALEPLAALLARQCDGAPVLIELTRAQCTAAYRSRHGGEATVTTGFDQDGRFRARMMTFDFAAGPYDGHSASVVTNAMTASLRLYPYGAVGAAGRAWATNTTMGGAYRGYGVPQAVFTVETHVDEVARLVGIDRIELRRRNVALAGALDPSNGVPMDHLRAHDCLDALDRELRAMDATDGADVQVPSPTTAIGNGRAAERPVGAAVDGRVLTGTGFALLVATSAAAQPGSPDEAEVAVRFVPALGRVVVEAAVSEAGQGIQAALVVAVARVLGAPPEMIAVEQGSELRDGGMFGSRGAHVTCSAAAAAALKLRECLSVSAAEMLGGPATVDFQAGVARPRSGDGVAALSELPAHRCVATFETERLALAFGAQAAQVQVDRLTGIVRVARVISIHDVGVLVAPPMATAQVEGGVLQGIGMALHETLTHRSDGTAIEQGLLGHLMPTIAELPEVRPVFIEAEGWAGPGNGAKGLGEATVMAMAAAIANAVADATGKMPTTFPMTAESLLRTCV